jgi:succinate-acetate transporter protein
MSRSSLTLVLWLVFAGCAVLGALVDDTRLSYGLWAAALAVAVGLLAISRMTGRRTVSGEAGTS